MTDDFITELKRTNKLLVLMLTKEMEQNEKVETLYKSGFQLKEIAELTGIKSAVVNTTLYRIKNKKL